MAASPTRWAECHWQDGILYASNLPDKGFAITAEPIPSGIAFTPAADGTWSIDLTWWESGKTAYFWQRGGGPSLIEVPRQYKDYKVIAICEKP